MVFIVLNGHCLYQTGVGGQTVEHTQMLDCHPEGPGQSLEKGSSRNLMKLQESKCQVLHLGRKKNLAAIQPDD